MMNRGAINILQLAETTQAFHSDCLAGSLPAGPFGHLIARTAEVPEDDSALCVCLEESSVLVVSEREYLVASSEVEVLKDGSTPCVCHEESLVVVVSEVEVSEDASQIEAQKVSSEMAATVLTMSAPQSFHPNCLSLTRLTNRTRSWLVSRTKKAQPALVSVPARLKDGHPNGSSSCESVQYPVTLEDVQVNDAPASVPELSLTGDRL
jgi:hypothetical protein